MQFIQLAKEAGFSEKQAEFLEEHLAKYPHTHDITEIDGLEEVLEGLDEGEDDAEED